MSVIKHYDYECPNSRFDNLLKTHPIAATAECYNLSGILSSIHYTKKPSNDEMFNLKTFYNSNIDKSKSCHDITYYVNVKNQLISTPIC